MANITISVPEKIKKKMKKFDEVNWSAYLRKQIEKKTKEIDELEELKKLLVKEKEAEYFAVNLQKKGRSGRLEELKKKGLL
ncbi:MAG: hypothetical protein ACMXX9_02055 [Candidatus Woesearchaeota archaeon]